MIAIARRPGDDDRAEPDDGAEDPGVGVGDGPRDGSDPRPGPLARLWLREVRGWPAALPAGREHVRSVLDLAADPLVAAEAERRVRASDPALSRLPVGLLLLDLATYAVLFVLILGGNLPVILGWLGVVVLVELTAGRAILRRRFHPSLRAVLRGVGTDCCIRCGHLGGGGGGGGGGSGGTRTARCPECGQHHEDLPLHWSRDLARP